MWSVLGFEDALWQVPVTIATAQNKEAYKFLLTERTATITMEGLQPSDWIKVCNIDYYILLFLVTY